MMRNGTGVLWVGLLCLQSTVLRGQPALERLERQLQSPQVQEPARDAGYLGVITRNNEAGGGFIRVVEVVADGPAAQAGLQLDDLIVSADGRITRQMNDLAGILQGRAPGDRVTLTVLRNQQDRTVNVVLGRRPQTAEGPALIPPRTAQSPAVNAPAVNSPAETIARRPPPVPQPEAINPGRVADAKTEQSRMDLLERRIAELERRLTELERLLSRRP